LYFGLLDGKFGAKTAAAVKAYKKKLGVKVDGIVDRNTWITLFK
jgi:peptidoglycan hydrolase-like protein with peptidoglycan-binding domain